MAELVGSILCAVVALVCLVVSILQFCEKGFLFNNAYIYASKQEKASMDKKPYYKQSGVVFLLLTFVFAINAVEVMLQTGWLFYLMAAIVVCILIYAIVSFIYLEKKKNKK